MVLAIWGIWAFLRAHQTDNKRYELAGAIIGAATFLEIGFLLLGLLAWFSYRGQVVGKQTGALRYLAFLAIILVTFYLLIPVNALDVWGVAFRILLPLWIIAVLLGAHALIHLRSEPVESTATPGPAKRYLLVDERNNPKPPPFDASFKLRSPRHPDPQPATGNVA